MCKLISMYTQYKGQVESHPTKVQTWCISGMTKIRGVIKKEIENFHLKSTMKCLSTSEKLLVHKVEVESLQYKLYLFAAHRTSIFHQCTEEMLASFPQEKEFGLLTWYIHSTNLARKVLWTGSSVGYLFPSQLLLINLLFHSRPTREHHRLSNIRYVS